MSSICTDAFCVVSSIYTVVSDICTDTSCAVSSICTVVSGVCTDASCVVSGICTDVSCIVSGICTDASFVVSDICTVACDICTDASCVVSRRAARGTSRGTWGSTRVMFAWGARIARQVLNPKSCTLDPSSSPSLPTLGAEP
jgi:hypothetical protein